MEDNKIIITTGALYSIIYFTNEYINNSATLTTSKHIKIEDNLLFIFIISFILFCGVYYYNILSHNPEMNTNSIITTWQQINYQGFLFISLFGLYIKLVPINIYSLLLYLTILTIYYPILEIINNYIYNSYYVPNNNDLFKAIDNCIDVYNKSEIITDTNTGYNITLNKDDPSEIMITFRGTDIKNIKNNISNININPINYNIDLSGFKNLINSIGTSVGIHSGYYTMYTSVKDILYKKCNELIANGATKIFISGHSLGAGLSTICTFDFHANLDKLNIKPENINSVHIAGPPVGNRYFVNIYNKYVLNTVNLYHINDPVPKMTSWIYESTKNNYVLISNKFSFDAHMLEIYKDIIKSQENSYKEYIKYIYISIPIIILLMYKLRVYYIKNNIKF